MKNLIKYIIVLLVFSFYSGIVYSQFKVENDGSIFVNSHTGNYGRSNWTKVHYQYSMAYNLWNNYYKSDVFYVQGDGKVYSRYGFLTESDYSSKANIQAIESPLEKIQNLQGIRFNRKYIKQTYMVDSATSLIAVHSGSETETGFEPLEYGLIAQEVEKVIPEAVYTMEDSTKTISYTSLVPVLIEAIKDQQNQIESLQALVNDHEAEMLNYKKYRNRKKRRK